MSESWALTKLRGRIIRECVVRGTVILTSGEESDYYVDLRRLTLSQAGAPLVGDLIFELTRDWGYSAVGGLSVGALPVACAVSAAALQRGTAVDAFAARAEVKAHGTRRRVEGPDLADREVLVVDDVVTTGYSALRAYEAATEAGARVVGFAAVLDRCPFPGGTRRVELFGLPYRYLVGHDQLGLGSGRSPA